MGLDKNRIICISSLSDQQWKVEVFPNDSNKSHFAYNIKGSTMVRFSYPLVLTVKGGTEIFVYNISENLYYYLSLPAPILIESSTSWTSRDSLNFWCLSDLGDYLVQWDWSFNYRYSSIYVMINKRYLEKKDFPNEKILTFFSPLNVKFLSNEENAYVIQFEKSILTYGMLSYGLVEKSDSDYEKGEIMNLEGDYLFFWKKQGKSVSVKLSPINFTDR